LCQGNSIFPGIVPVDLVASFSGDKQRTPGVQAVLKNERLLAGLKKF